MAITNEQRAALQAVAAKATEVAEQIHQDWGSAVEGGVQSRVNVDIPKHGPDKALQDIEHLLGAVVHAISEYLRQPPRG